MVLYKGKTERFFSVLPKKVTFIFTLVLMAVWIPFGAGPRCIHVSYDTLSYLFSSMPKGMYILVYSTLVWLVIQRPTKMIQVLGYGLTPILLISLICLWSMGMWDAPTLQSTTKATEQLVYEGVVYGYNTLDFIAGFFYSSSLIFMLQRTGMQTKKILKKVFLAGSMGMLFLSAVYFSFTYLAAHYASELQSLQISQYLGFLSMHLLGPAWSSIPVLAVFLACLTTSIAMSSVFTNYLYRQFFISLPKGGMFVSRIVAVALTMTISLLDLASLLKIIAPVLQASSHFLLLLTVINLVRRHYKTEVESSFKLKGHSVGSQE